MSINRVIISGNLTRDPELRSTAGGLPVLGFGVAVNDRRKNQQTGEWEDYPNFIDCTMFGAAALEPVGARRPEAFQDRGDRGRVGVHVQPQQRFLVRRQCRRLFRADVRTGGGRSDGRCLFFGL